MVAENQLQEKMTIERATQEINEWLDYKKISPKKRETHKDSIETLVDALQCGTIVIKEDKTIVHKLLFPITVGPNEEVTTSEITYQPRIRVEALNLRLKGISSNDVNGRLMGYVYAITKQPTNSLNGIDTEDLSIATAIATFFI